MITDIARYFLNILAHIKMLHWFAHTYNSHKIFDSLYEELSSEIDDLMEALMSSSSKNIPLPPSKINQNFLTELQNFVDKIQDKAARAPVENIIQIVAKHKYLLSLNS